MKVLGLRSVPLAKDTMAAWSNAGVRFAKRGRTLDEVNRIVNKYGYDTILNLGNMEFDTLDLEVEVFNETDTIRAVSLPQNLRETMEPFIPANGAVNEPHWHKRGGYGGRGAQFCETERPGCINAPGDRQQHIDGTEYRVITVGDKIVQASRKDNVRWVNGQHSFDWTWVGVDGVRTNGIIPHIKGAIQTVPIFDRSVFGWDVIVSDGGVYTLEVNTSPGVNEFTALRIMEAMRNV